MSKEKSSKVVELLREKKEAKDMDVGKYNMAINVRKKTIEQYSLYLKSLKDITRDLARKNVSTRFINATRAQYVGDYNNHVAVLCNLKQMLAAAREEAHLLGIALNKLEE